MRLLSVFLMVLALHPRAAHGAFIGLYDPANFTSAFTNSDGTAILDGNGNLVMTGGNNGSGLPGNFTFLIQASLAGLVTFNWSVTTLDSPGGDTAGYRIGNTFVPLGDFDGATGSASFSVSLGDWFGFQIDTTDNGGEPAVFTISDFSAPTGGSAVPEPGTWVLGLLGLAALRAGSCLRGTSS